MTVVPGTYPGDRAMWQSLVAHPEPLRVPAQPIAAIAPHHLIDGFELGAFWKALADAGPAPVVVVIGPDHRGRGAGDVTVATAVRFDTAFGELEPDPALVEQLSARVPLGVRDVAFKDEHSIHVHAPFIRRFLPGARVLPLIVRWGAAPATLDALAQALDQVLPPGALLVASVDFSHFQAEPWASFHDEASWATLAGLEANALFDREVDSPESLYVTLRFAAARQAIRATQVLHTNSQSRRAVFVPDSTSHLYVTFTRGDPAPMPSVSVLVTGEVATSTGLRLRNSWRWHSATPAETPNEPRLAEVRGQEDRFFMGADALLFRLEPGEREERTLHGLRVAFAATGLSRVDAEATVKRLKGEADCLFLLAIRGEEPLESATAQVRALSDAGADVVIGRGFGASTPIEYRDPSGPSRSPRAQSRGGAGSPPSLDLARDDRVTDSALARVPPPGTDPALSQAPPRGLIALSLGDFLPDSRADGEGTALGVTWTRTGVRARTLPLKLLGGGPRVDLNRLADSMGYDAP